VIVVLVVACNAAAGAQHSGRRATSQPPVALVASYQFTQGRSGYTEVWFLDNRGKEFMLSRPLDNMLGEYTSHGSLSSSDVARLIKFARPVARSLNRADLEHAVMLVAAAQRSTLGTHQKRKSCNDGSTVKIHAYVLPPGKISQQAVLLHYSFCGSVVDENLSPEAQELIGWTRLRWSQARPSAP